MSGPAQRMHVRVRYSETDQMGVVYHAHYLVWMEVGRTELLRALGHPYEELERAGLLFAVSEVHCRYSGAARYGEVVTVTTEITSVRSRDVRFGYRIDGERGEIARGQVTVVALDRDRRPRRIPPELLADLRACCAGSAPRALEEVLLA